MKWFGEPKSTKEDAQLLHEFSLFNPAGVFLTETGEFVLSLLRCDSRWSDEFIKQIAEDIQTYTGNKLVSYCDPLLGVWHDYRTC